MADLSSGERRAGCCLGTLALLVVLVAVAVVQLNRIGDVMINGAPRFDADELRSRPTLQQMMPAYVGAMEAVAATVLAARATPSAEATGVEDGDDDPWIDEVWSEFSGEPVFRGEQVVDGMVVRLWEARASVEGTVPDDPEVRAALGDDLLAVAASYGFRQSSSWTASEDEAALLRAFDTWGASIDVHLDDDLVVTVHLRTGLHLSSGSEVVPEGDVRAPRRPELGPEAV